MTDPMEPSKTGEVTRLLFKAVKSLPDDEQRVVFEYFFERGLTVPPTGIGPLIPEGADPRAMLQRAWSDPSALATLFSAQKPMGSERIMIPVRLSEAQHRRLKDWCAEHNFPMAVVVRGLVDRFLSSWDKRAQPA